MSPENEIIGEGHNFLPREDLSWNNEADKEEDTKYAVGTKANNHHTITTSHSLYTQTKRFAKHMHTNTVTHAAVEAIEAAYKQKESPEGATLYTNLYPSSRDGVTILRAGVKELVFLDKKVGWRKRYHTGDTKKLLDGKVQCRYVHC